MIESGKENIGARVPLYLDSLDERLDILMGTLRAICQKVGPVLSDSQPSEVEVAEPAQDKGLSSVASRLSHMDDQVLRMIKEVAYVTERIEL